ncbi:MAG: hypothetical protein EON93_08505 [Burkholderiales bacterium]|nr:MAG: hypothetical protein EON93_08505 [Burkholderiales bacterium]
MNSRTKLMLLVGVSTIVLAACGGGGDFKVETPPPVVVVPPVPGEGSLENMFGVGFGALFRAGANTDPAEPKDTDLIALTLTADAVAVP